MKIRPETQADRSAVDNLVLEAFGPGRFAKIAERLREGNHPWTGLGHIADLDATIVGSCAIWPVDLGGCRFAMLGPIAVGPRYRGDGLGQRLVAACLEACDAVGVSGVFCVGPEGFFAPFGFAPVRKDVTLPGPVDPARVLFRPLVPGTPSPAGEISVPRDARPA